MFGRKPPAGAYPVEDGETLTRSPETVRKRAKGFGALATRAGVSVITVWYYWNDLVEIIPLEEFLERFIGTL